MGWFRNRIVGIGGEIIAARAQLSLMKAESEVQAASILLRKDPNAYLPKSDMVDPFAYEGLTAFGYREKLALLDFPRLRLIAWSDPIVAAILQTRVNQVASFARQQVDKYKVGFKVTLRDQEREPNRAEKRRIDELTQFMEACGVPQEFEDMPRHRRRDNFEQFLRKLTRDSLMFDQACFEITPRRNGLPYEFGVVDAATIRIVPDDRDLRQTNLDRTDLKQGILRNTSIADTLNPASREEGSYHARVPRYCQIVNGVVNHLFDEQEMAFGVRNPRSDVLAFGYGFSELEMLTTIVTAHMNAENYNRKFFSQGTTAKGILSFSGDVARDQLQEFRRMWHMQATGIQNAWKTPIVAPGKETKVEWTDLQKTNREMEYGKWMEYCIKVMCAVFQMDPIEISFDISRMGQSEGANSSGLGSTGDPSERLIHSQDKGLKPLLRFLETLINVYVIWRIDPDFCLEFEGLGAGTEADDLAQAEKEVKVFKTVNEIRAEHDLPPLPDLETITSPGDLILEPSIISAWGQGLQAKTQADLQAQQGEGEEGEGLEATTGDGAREEYEEEPDYESMDESELTKELQKIRNGGGTEKALRRSIQLRL